MKSEIFKIKSFYLLYWIMPQMSPMNWLALFLAFTALWGSVLAKSYFN